MYVTFVGLGGLGLERCCFCAEVCLRDGMGFCHDERSGREAPGVRRSAWGRMG